MSLRKKALNGVLWTILQNVVRRTATLVVFVILARLLGPDDFGLVAMASLFSIIGEELAKMGLSAALVQRPELENEHVNSAFWSTLVLGFGLYGILCIIAPFFEAWLDAKGLANVLIWIGLGLVINSVSKMPEALLKRSLRFKQLAIRTMVGTVVGGVLGVVLALKGAGVWSLVAKELIEVCVASAMVWKASGWLPSFRFSTRHLRQLLPFGVYELGSSLLQLLNQHLDRMVISVYMTPVVLGQYVVGKRLMLILQQLSNKTLSTVMFPVLTKIQDDEEKFKAVYLRISRLIIFVAGPVFSALLLEGEQIVTWVFGEKWFEASQVARVLGGVGLLQSATLLAQPALKAKGFPNLAVRLGWTRTLLDVVLFYLFLPMGVIGIAFALLCRAAIMVPIAVATMNAAFSYPRGEYFKGLRSSLFGILTFSGVSLLLGVFFAKYSNSMVFVVAQLSASLLAYILMINILDRSLIKDLLALRQGFAKNNV